jgi:putative nucleotidyltransferase with HDIG domain
MKLESAAGTCLRRGNGSVPGLFLPIDKQRPVLIPYTMLTYQEAFELLSSYGHDAPWIRHCVAVSRVAQRVAGLISANRALDSRLLVVGALLHDIGRYKTQDAILHGVEGYHLLSSLGHHQEAFICASHVLCGMGRREAARHGLPEQDFIPRTLEERLVPLIDSVVELDRPTSFEARCASITRRYHKDPQFLNRFVRAAETARTFMREIREDLGLSLEAIALDTLSPADADLL